MRFYTFVLFFFYFSLSLFSYEIHLKDKLLEANPGSYLVLEQNKTFTFLHIQECTERNIVIEEVSIPQARFARKRMNWKDWFERGAPGHTAWLVSQVNLSTGQFEETFSYTHQGWIDLSESSLFLTTLLNLRFQPVPNAQRRRIGATPSHRKPDQRPFWNPRLIVDGQRIAHVPFTVWHTRWPSDGSELSRKKITIYLPQAITDGSAPTYPTYFPYWFEVEGKIGSAKVRVVDSGMGARSPKGAMPHRPLTLLGAGTLQGDGLTLSLQAPPYYKEFMLMAEEADALTSKSFLLPCKITFFQNESVSLSVSKEELDKEMIPGQRYRFIVIPKEDPALSVATKRALVFNAL